MSVWGETVREIRRGNDDRETFFPPLFYLACRRRFARMTPDQIARYQLRRAQNVVHYAVRYAPFFRHLYHGYNLDDVWSLPTVDKKTMMSNLGDWNTVGLSRQEVLDFCLHVERRRDFSLRLKGLNIGMSSGTSGNKGVEITSPREESYLRAAFFARFPFPGGLPLGRNAARWAFILRVSTPAFDLKLLGNRLAYISQLDTLDSICAQLAALDPTIVSAPPSMLRLLAGQQKQGRLNIHPLRLVSYAEILYPQVRDELEQVFGCPVIEIYKATEGAIAMPCAQGRLHINEDLVAVELLDADGTPTPPGRPCQRMLVTDLHKTSQPIIRYALNDLVTVSPERCPCGSHFRVIEHIQGRSDDLFWGRRTDTNERQVIFPDYIARAVISVGDEVEEYQVIQTDLDALSAYIQLTDSTQGDRVAAQVRQALQRVFAALHCHLPQVMVITDRPSPYAHSAKRIRIRSEIKELL